MEELRKIWLQLEAIIGIPRSHHTIYRSDAFQVMSVHRFGLLIAMSLARVAIASILLIAGNLWLARTTSIADLMLNAVALNAIIDVDEMIFTAILPLQIKHAMQRLKPVRVTYGRRRSQRESVVHFGFFTALLLSVYLLLLVPLADAMLATKNELCGGNQTFVVRYNPDTQLSYGLVTRSSREYGHLSPIELAVQAHKATSPETTPDASGPTYILFSTNKKHFDAGSTRSMREESSEASSAFCLETSVLSESSIYSQDPEARLYATRMLKNAAASLGRANASTCQAPCVPSWATCAQGFDGVSLLGLQLTLNPKPKTLSPKP